MPDIQPPHIVTSADGNTRFIATTDGGRAEMRLLVNGVLTWREARWEREVIGRFCSSRYGIREDEGMVLRPVVREGERLLETLEGPVAIVTICL